MAAFEDLLSDPLAAVGLGLLTSRENPLGVAMQQMQAAAKAKRDQENEALDRKYKEAQMRKMERGDSGFKVIGNQLVKFDENTGTAEPVYTATNTGPINPDTGLPERKLSASEQKELFDTMDTTSSLNSAKTALTQAQGILTNSPAGEEPYSGIGANTRTALARAPDWMVPDFVAKPSRGAATTEYKNLVSEQALSNLKAIFGGNPTEGERTILLQLQAMPDYTRPEQELILKNAVAAADRRLAFNAQKTKAINSGTYSQMGKDTSGGNPTPPAGGNDGWSIEEVQ